eukprot:TRINITY_DN1215_c0_g1_i1.p2 TRINITY_DN1215_c0_g1~~TRINITY_DN1215_c0_g1_i1.p2  ORF type:complete len:56 (-),score=6.99 TRINITY_DN1215_c0_g1_i1:100-267(-)
MTKGQGAAKKVLAGLQAENGKRPRCCQKGLADFKVLPKSNVRMFKQEQTKRSAVV